MFEFRTTESYKYTYLVECKKKTCCHRKIRSLHENKAVGVTIREKILKQKIMPHKMHILQKSTQVVLKKIKRSIFMLIIHKFRINKRIYVYLFENCSACNNTRFKTNNLEIFFNFYYGTPFSSGPNLTIVLIISSS